MGYILTLEQEEEEEEQQQQKIQTILTIREANILNTLIHEP